MAATNFTNCVSKKVLKMRTRRFADVIWLVPNQLDLLRIVLAFVACTLAEARPLLAATLYVVSHYIDLWDGHVARALGQCSQLGMMLDYATDIATESMWFVCMSPHLPVGWRIVCCALTLVNVAGLVLCVYNSAQNRYWKNADVDPVDPEGGSGDERKRPWLQTWMIGPSGYTRFGYTCVFVYQVFWALLFVHFTNALPSCTTKTLLVGCACFWALEIASLGMIVWEQCHLYREKQI